MHYMQRGWRSCVLAVVIGGVAIACGTHRVTVPHVEIGAFAEGIDEFLRRHPLAAGQAIRADEVLRTEQASWHLVQVRGAESPHDHADHDLQVVLLRGRGDLHLGTRTVVLGRGDVAVIRRGARHWFVNRGDVPSVALVTYVPPAPQRR
jgi:mannose-6-phosphate isomerase-like protein (cupin superfamily)